MTTVTDLYSAAPSDITFDMVKSFVLAAEDANLLTESLTLELKEKRSNDNIVQAVASLANTDGGIVIVGVAEGKQLKGAERIKGVPQAEHDSIVSQFKSFIPNDIPEVISVKLPDADRVVLLLRVNADTAQRPVVVGGKVYYRIPGQKAPADHQRIVDLVVQGRGEARSQGIQVYAPQIIAREIPLWPENDPNEVAVFKFSGGFLLPGRILDRPWLDTPAKDAILNALNGSPIPEKPWGSAPGQSDGEWKIFRARATNVKVCVPVSGNHLTEGDAPISAAAYIGLTGRRLFVILGTRLCSQSTLNLTWLYHIVLASLLTIMEVCRRAATALGADSPVQLDDWEGWIQPKSPVNLNQLLKMEFAKDSDLTVNGGEFPSARIAGDTIDDLDRLARNWVTVLLLELGYRDFESPLSDIARPGWAHLSGAD